ncbi:hypothetical protein [Sneathiella sp.]|uniref:hypothetical protein n=1 Tax=Sneathiella sp. TaxID=1964365 RepID=UPI00356B0C05
MALAFALNIFAVIPAAESHEKGENVSHYVISAMGDFSKAPAKSYHNHVEKCGVASCAIGLPAYFSVTTTAFGTKTPFNTIAAHATLRHLTPLDRPPKN